MSCCEGLRNNMKVVIGAVIAIILAIGIGVAVFFVIKKGDSTAAGNNSTKEAASASSSVDKGSEADAVKSEGFEDYQIATLDLHNELRALHGVPPLKLDKLLNEVALKCAKYYADLQERYVPHTCPFLKEKGKWISDNISRRIWPDTVPLAHRMEEISSKSDKEYSLVSTQSWYDEIKLYDFDKPNTDAEVLHFTLMIWKTVKELGMGVFRREDGNIFLVATYTPPGNVFKKPPNEVQRFIENVPRPLS